MKWDERYAEPGFAYGTEPNEFLVAVASHVPPGPVLCLAEGQGRNAVYLAQRGHRVLAVDQSPVGLERARGLAAERGVILETEVADLDSFVIAPGTWAGIVSIWAHVPHDLRRRLHRAVVAGLAPGGIFILEAYTPEQLALGTGGPPTADRMMRLADLREELTGLELVIARELEREVHEGAYHHGRGAVVQVLARKPGGASGATAAAEWRAEGESRGLR